MLSALGGPLLFLLGTILFKHTFRGFLQLSHGVGIILLAISAWFAGAMSPLMLAPDTAILIIVAVWESISLKSSDGRSAIRGLVGHQRLGKVFRIADPDSGTFKLIGAGGSPHPVTAPDRGGLIRSLRQNGTNRFVGHCVCLVTRAEWSASITKENDHETAAHRRACACDPRCRACFRRPAEGAWIRQQTSIANGVANGSITPREFKRLEKREASILHQAVFLRSTGGHLGPFERAYLGARLAGARGTIFFHRHN